MAETVKALCDRLPVYVVFRIEHDISRATRCWESIAKAEGFDAKEAGDIACELCHFIADFIESWEMKLKGK